MDIRTLQYWHRLEHFYPYPLQQDTRRNVHTYRVAAPDQFPTFPPQDLVLSGSTLVKEYKVFLGIFRVDSALDALEKSLDGEERFRDPGKEESCFCQFSLDSSGRLQLGDFRISTFPWAVHWIKDGHIRSDQWDEAFSLYETGMFLYLQGLGQEPVTFAALEEALTRFAAPLCWEPGFSDCWLRIDCVTGEKKAEEEETTSTPEERETDTGGSTEEEDDTAEADRSQERNQLLNSFYIRDLERIIQGLEENPRQCGESFRRYLEHSAKQRINLECDRDALTDLLDPDCLPKGKWPGYHGLRLMQQVDVNAFLADSPYRQPLFSVNGPPGTGKTTLLKDLVAALVVERAIALCDLKKPNDAFESQPVCTIVTENIEKQTSYTNYVRELKPPYRQHGILVASSNNNAVSNITYGLPALEGLPREYRGEEYRYFSQVSDRLLGRGKTWGITAATLGKWENRKKFAEHFWPISRQDFGAYNFREVLDSSLEALKQDGKRMENWSAAKAAFQTALVNLEEELEAARQVYPHARRALSLGRELAEAEKVFAPVERECADLEERIDRLSRGIRRLRTDREHHKRHLQAARESDPLLPVRLWAGRGQWSRRYRDLLHRVQEDGKRLEALEKARQEARRVLEARQNERHYLGARRDLLKREYQAEILELEAFRIRTGAAYRLDLYLLAPAGEAGKSSPWSYPRLNSLREILFLEAMQLHRAFVLHSPWLRDNLDAFSKQLRGWLSPDKPAAAASPLLQSFFLAVPVVSTTFASVGSFLEHIPAEDIGYLCIDEAGQASPQSAAGAIWRSRRVIAVGDPLQIEPVVTLHDSVIQDLATQFGQETDSAIVSKFSSVQSLADLANPLGGYRTLEAPGDLWIGAPLLVHSRCQRKVFDIANEIAYNGKMVYATQDGYQPVCQWLQVEGRSEGGHFVAEQAQAALSIVQESFAQYAEEKVRGRYPSLFVITPFRSVRDGLMNAFGDSLYDQLEEAGIGVSRACVRAWTRACVGTIHTFQGKEADTVILCLGVDSSSGEHPAVGWACERPNILNVAITRSRRSLYIIGDKAVWGHRPFFETALRVCSETQRPPDRQPQLVGGII